MSALTMAELRRGVGRRKSAKLDRVVSSFLTKWRAHGLALAAKLAPVDGLRTANWF